MSESHLGDVSDHDLVLSRTVPLPRPTMWRAWTDPELLKRWFTPAPWKTMECEIDLRPGGIFRTVMQGPDGDVESGAGCFLEVVTGQRLVWTSALGPGYRPTEDDPMPFTAVITFEDHREGTLYTVRLLHRNGEDARHHTEMGSTGVERRPGPDDRACRRYHLVRSEPAACRNGSWSCGLETSLTLHISRYVSPISNRTGLVG